ncbi:MAG TPA: NUDIX hydrolase [Kofleriaceae bacterium]|nr:NUDIX hydrolase [Kofleriaceae bacterium]
MSASAPVRPVVAAAGVAFDQDGRVLLVRRGRPPNQQVWSVPGGRIEPGEPAADAAVREVAEETGLAVRAVELVTAVDWIERGDDGALQVHYVILDYLVEVIDGALVAGDDAAEAGWFAPDQLARLSVTAGLHQVIERAREMARERGLATRPRVR